MDAAYTARQPSTSAVQSALMPRLSAHLVKSAIRLERQSTTVPNTSNTSALTAEISDMFTPVFVFLRFRFFRHSGASEARARNPYSRSVVMDSGPAPRGASRNDGDQSTFRYWMNPRL